MPEAGKLRLVLDYVPCDACLAIPAASPAEQELLCGICRRLDRRVGHKITVRRTVAVPTPEVPLEVVVPPAAAVEPAPVEAVPPLPTVEVVLAEGGELPPPAADLQIVLAPVDLPAPSAPLAAEEGEEIDDLFGYTAETREELFDFVPPAAAEPAPPAPSESYVIEPAQVAPEEWPTPLEPVEAEAAPPEPTAWPAEPAEETPRTPTPWPEEPEPEPAAQPTPWPDAQPQPAVEEPAPVEEVEEIPEAVAEVPEAEEVPEPVEEVPPAEEEPAPVEEVSEEAPEAVEEVSEAAEEPAPPAGGEGDLPVSALEGLGARYQRRLGEEGVTNLRELAGRDPAELADLTGIPERFLAKWVEEAKRRSG